MLYQIYGENAAGQLLGWLSGYFGTDLANELAKHVRRSEGYSAFDVRSIDLYFIAIYVGR